VIVEKIFLEGLILAEIVDKLLNKKIFYILNKKFIELAHKKKDMI